MAGGFRIEVSLRSDGAGGARSGDVAPPIFAYGGLALWSEEPTIRIDARTIVIGHLFTRGRPSKRVMSELLDAGERLVADKGRLLLTGYWGGYVMVHVDRAGTVMVMRDPSGALPCYVLREEDRATFAGCLTDLIAPGRGRVDFEEIARILASGDARGRRTCVGGIEELVAGECMAIGGNGISAEAWWSPWDHVARPDGLNFAEAAAELHETVADCVGAWASCFSSILLGSSGGLDSSIVAAAAGPRAERLTCLTFYGPDFDGDERRYASVLAGALGLQLREAPRDLAHIDINHATPHQPWPVAGLSKQTNAAYHNRLQQELSTDAHFSGNGGDAILCSMRSAVPFIDRFLAEGPRPALATTLHDICVLTGADRRTVLRHAWDRYRRNGGRHAVRFNPSGLVADVMACIEAAGAIHPWLAAPRDALPGKSVHIAYFMRTQKSLELYPRAGSPPHLAPLLSQPIIELCLSIPSWMWIKGGRNRAVARSAFEGRLPTLITERTQKGGPGGFDLAIYRRHRAALLDHLRGGLLAQAGILDTALLDLPEDPSWRGTERIQRVLAFAAAENWARWWNAAMA